MDHAVVERDAAGAADLFAEGVGGEVGRVGVFAFFEGGGFLRFPEGEGFRIFVGKAEAGGVEEGVLGEPHFDGGASLGGAGRCRWGRRFRRGAWRRSRSRRRELEAVRGEQVIQVAWTSSAGVGA